jgi:hypothetical protein
MIMVIQNGAAVLAVATATRVFRRIGLDRVVAVFAPVAAAALFLIPAASRLPPLIVLAGYGMVFGYCTTVWAIGSASLQQIFVPPGQIGRVIALSASIGLVVIPVGAVAGGVLANVWGVEPTMLLAAFVALAGTLAVAARPGIRAAEIHQAGVPCRCAANPRQRSPRAGSLPERTHPLQPSAGQPEDMGRRLAQRSSGRVRFRPGSLPAGGLRGSARRGRRRAGRPSS